MKVHFTGICGTGMGQLAMLFRELGHEVRGSDTAFDPPTGPALTAVGIGTTKGYAVENLGWEPDLVVIGNVIRKDNPEATFARETKLNATSMSGALRTHPLPGRRAVVVTGTHGKTTTSTMVAHMLRKGDLEPGWFIGGVPKNLPSGSAVGKKARSLLIGDPQIQ